MRTDKQRGREVKHMGRIMSAGKRLAACSLVIGMTAGLSLSAYALTTKEKLDQAQQEREQTKDQLDQTQENISG